MSKNVNKPEAWLTVTLSVAAILLALGYASSVLIPRKSPSVIVSTPTPTPKNVSKPSPTSRSSSPSITIPPQTERRYDWGTYKSCTVYSRGNMNTYGSNINVLDNASEIRCNVDGAEKTMVSVTDKKGFPDAANSIYRFWKDSDGYKILLVDQNGAGSGEGHGKVVQLFNDYGVTRSCFYFVSHNFVQENVPIEWGTPLSFEEQAAVQKNLIEPDSSYCSNFTLTSSVR